MLSADCTRAFKPACRMASCRASAFMMVASIPMSSAVARSIPAAPGATPRKILPPPITTAISSPSAATWAISPTMRSIVARLIPKESSPIRASPLSLSRMRLYFADAAISGSFFGLVFILLRFAHLLHDFGGEIARSLLDALAHDVEHETRYRGALCFQYRFDTVLLVLDETLSE